MSVRVFECLICVCECVKNLGKNLYTLLHFIIVSWLVFLFIHCFFVCFCFQMKENLKPAICVSSLLGCLF